MDLEAWVLLGYLYLVSCGVFQAVCLEVYWLGSCLTGFCRAGSINA